jgi:hypothetical protein
MTTVTRILLGLALSCLLVSLPRLEASAQNALTPALALARLCVSEAGWECWDTGDGFGIHEVLLRGSARQGLRYETFARAYARRLFGARPHDVPRLRWVGEMNEAGTAPPAWPATVTHRRGGVVHVAPHAPWLSYRARWMAVLERARTVVAEMTLDDVDEWGVCDSEVHDWGGWMDRGRAQRMGLVAVECGITDDGTRNDFYCRPSVSECVSMDRE